MKTKKAILKYLTTVYPNVYRTGNYSNIIDLDNEKTTLLSILRELCLLFNYGDSKIIQYSLKKWYDSRPVLKKSPKSSSSHL